ncbi:hypothetical protein ACIP9H_35070 [Streptomyces sp. NPDC088732]|uniref:hypothetical protein n=1 Tax=Streptomyces sp. NPDC088732 TaxID=3365879 RepID=UPI0038243FD6
MAGLVGWESFGVMTGGASGALTGLLFVAVSLNAERIAGHPVLRAIAAQTLVLFLAPLVMATVLLVPRQPDWALGTEFITAGLNGNVSLLVIERRKRRVANVPRRRAGLFDRRDTGIVVMLLFVAGGAVLACGLPTGLYLLLPASVVAFVSGVLSAWNFLLPPPDVM